MVENIDGDTGSTNSSYTITIISTNELMYGRGKNQRVKYIVGGYNYMEYKKNVFEHNKNLIKYINIWKMV